MMKGKRERERRYLRCDGRVEVGGEEVVMEIFEGESVPSEPSNVMSFVCHLLHHLLSLHTLLLLLALNLRQEAAELIGGHVWTTLGVLVEEVSDLRRRRRICHLKPPAEAEADTVAGHVNCEVMRVKEEKVSLFIYEKRKWCSWQCKCGLVLTFN